MNRFWKTVLLTSLFVGVTDLILAYTTQYIKTGQFADKMLFYMAGGALGLETSMQGGFLIGLLGLFFHFFIAFSFTILVFIVFPIFKMQSLNIYLILALGMLYAPFVNCFMRYIVLPLTKLPAKITPLQVEKEIVGWIILGIVFTVPIFLSASRYYKSTTLVNKSI